MRPAADERVGLDRLVAEGGGAGAVDHAPERARDLPRAVRVDVAAEHAVGRRQPKVEAAHHPIGVVDRLGLAEVVVGSRLVRKRDEVEDAEGDRVHAVLGNDAAGERPAGERIADGAGEDTRAVVERRYAREARHPAGDAGALVVDEEERLVLDQGAAQVAAELVLVVGRRDRRRARERRRALRQEVDRVQAVVAEELVGRAVQVVGAGLGGDGDGGPGGAPVLRGVGAGDDLELLDRVDRRAGDLARQLLHVLRDAVVVHPVEQEVVLQRAGAVHVDAPGAAEGGAAPLLGVAVALHAGHERQQVVPVADRERKPRDRGLLDDRAERRLLGVDHAAAALHRDRLFEPSHTEVEVGATPLADLEEEAPRGLLEAWGFRRDQVVAGGEVGRRVVAFGVGLRPDGDVGGGVGHDDGGAGNVRTLRVADDPAERGAVDLGVSQGRGTEHQHAHGRESLHRASRLR